MPPYDPWRDVHGHPIPAQCRIEQVAVGKNHGALPSRLQMHGEVVGRALTRLTVRFDGEDELIGIRPHLVRVLQQRKGRLWVRTETTRVTSRTRGMIPANTVGRTTRRMDARTRFARCRRPRTPTSTTGDREAG